MFEWGGNLLKAPDYLFFDIYAEYREGAIEKRSNVVFIHNRTFLCETDGTIVHSEAYAIGFLLLEQISLSSCPLLHLLHPVLKMFTPPESGQLWPLFLAATVS